MREYPCLKKQKQKPTKNKSKAKNQTHRQTEDMQPPNDSLKHRSWWQMPPQWMWNQNLSNIFIILLNERGCLLPFEELIPWNVLNAVFGKKTFCRFDLWPGTVPTSSALKCQRTFRLQEAVSVTSPRSWPLISRHEMDGAICENKHVTPKETQCIMSPLYLAQVFVTYWPINLTGIDCFTRWAVFWDDG